MGDQDAQVRPYLFVDEDGWEITVYSSIEDTPLYLVVRTKDQALRRRTAERFAAALAELEGWDWGTNYP